MTPPRRGNVGKLARAKINLALHVTGKRNDGYHLLDSLVVFAGVGDQLDLAPADHTGLEISGPFGKDLSVTGDNLILRAFKLLSQSQINPLPATKFHLQKNLPVSSGIGGGSADAAAALNGLIDLWQLEIEPENLTKIALCIGADVPVCLTSTTSWMRGIGEEISTVDNFLPLHCVLVNAGIGVSTPDVFKQLSLPTGQPAFSAMPPLPNDNWLEWLGQTRNDLQDAAIALTPEIEQTFSALAQTPGCQLARMSGSGATCFGLFANTGDAKKASEQISSTHPDWWVAPTILSD